MMTLLIIESCETDPYKIKQISSRIKNSQEKWQSTAKQIVTKAITAKFLQYKALLEILKQQEEWEL